MGMDKQYVDRRSAVQDEQWSVTGLDNRWVGKGRRRTSGGTNSGAGQLSVRQAEVNKKGQRTSGGKDEVGKAVG